MKKRDTFWSIFVVCFVSLFALTLITYGALSKNYNFTAGTVITAAEVNSNFDQLFAAFGNLEYGGTYVTNNDSLTTSVANLDTAIYNVSNDVATNKGKVRMVTGDTQGMRMLSDTLDQDTVTWDTSTHKLKVNETFSPVPRGFISGVTLSNHGVTSLDVSIGVARSSADTYNIKLTSSIKKDLALARTSDGLLAPGGLDTGAIAANTGYHVWLYKHITWTTGDVIYSASATNPAIPYGVGRRIGWVTTDASSHIKTFDQMGNYFIIKNPELCIKDSSVSNAASTTYTLPVPNGVRVKVYMNARVDGAANRGIYFSNPSVVDIEPPNTLVLPPLVSLLIPAAVATDNGGQVMLFPNRWGQIKARAVSAATGLHAMITAWEDFRGQDE